jgi:hypothetical protein
MRFESAAAGPVSGNLKPASSPGAVAEYSLSA